MSTTPDWEQHSSFHLTHRKKSRFPKHWDIPWHHPLKKKKLPGGSSMKLSWAYMCKCDKAEASCQRVRDLMPWGKTWTSAAWKFHHLCESGLCLVQLSSWLWRFTHCSDCPSVWTLLITWLHFIYIHIIHSAAEEQLVVSCHVLG